MSTSNNRRLTAAALIVMSSTIVSRISGYIRETLITNKLGVNTVGDAYGAAFLVPDLMFQLLLGGALAAAIIPILSGYIEKKDEAEGWKVVGTFLNVTIIAMVVFCILGMIFTPQIIPIIASGLKEKGIETQLLAIRLTRILFPSIAFLMLAGMCNGVLNSYHRFAAAAYGPVIYNIGGALSLYFLGSPTDTGAVRVAYGVMLSAFVYFVFQLISALKNLKYYTPRVYIKDPGFIRMVKLAIPSLISSAITQINIIISSGFATFAAAGSLVLFNTANRTWQLPLGIFGQSMGVALLPSMSAKLAIGQVEEFKQILNKGLKTVLFLSVPSAVAIVVLREPIVRTLFKFSAEFDETSVQITGYILMFFSVALIAQSAQALLGRAFFAANDTKTPLYIGLTTILINWFFSYILYQTMGVAGMALANSISSVVYSSLLIVILNRRLKGLHLKKVGIFAIKVLMAALLMGVVLYPLNRVLPVNIQSKLSQVTALGIEVCIGVLVYFAAAMLFKMEEALFYFNLVLSRLQGISRRLGFM